MLAHCAARATRTWSRARIRRASASERTMKNSDRTPRSGVDPPHTLDAAGVESVWDYPRPPALERTVSRITVVLAGHTVADTTQAFRVLETSHPPVYYLPFEDVDMACVTATGRTTFCEFKGVA